MTPRERSKSTQPALSWINLLSYLCFLVDQQVDHRDYFVSAKYFFLSADLIPGTAIKPQDGCHGFCRRGHNSGYDRARKIMNVVFLEQMGDPRAPGNMGRSIPKAWQDSNWIFRWNPAYILGFFYLILYLPGHLL